MADERDGGAQDPSLHRLSVPALFGSLAVLLAGVCFALDAPGAAHTWGPSMLSDLGAQGCFDAPGRRICSPRHLWFNLAQITSGALLIVSALGDLPSGWSVAPRPFSRLARAACGTGLVMLGAFPSDGRHAWHMTGAVLALPIAAALMLGSAATSGRQERRFALTMCASLALVGSALHLVPGQALRGVAELVAVLFLGLALVIDCLGRGRRDAGFTHPGA